jgi:hypothetical protein
MSTLFDDLRTNPKLVSCFITAGIFALVVIWLIIAWRDDLALLAALIGTAIGWAMGMLLAPYPEEAKRFQRLSKGIAGFLTGYVVGKVDRVFDLLLDKSSGAPLILSTQLQRRFWLSLACLVVSAVTVFVARSYWQGIDDEEEDEEVSELEADDSE